MANTFHVSLYSIGNKHSHKDTVRRTANQSLKAPTLLYFAINQKTTAKKQKIPAKFNTISATINTAHLQYTSQGAPTYPFLPIVIVCISAPPGTFWSCLHQTNTTIFSDLHRLFNFNIKVHFKITRRKRLGKSSRRILNDTTCGSPPSPHINDRAYFLRVSTLAAYK